MLALVDVPGPVRIFIGMIGTPDIVRQENDAGAKFATGVVVRKQVLESGWELKRQSGAVAEGVPMSGRL